MSQTIELKYPIDVNGAEVKSVSVRRMTVGDLEIANLEKNEFAKSIRMVATLTDLAPDDVRKMDSSDFMKMSVLVTDFLG